MNGDDKRDALREKIEAGEKRHEERSIQAAAKEAADNATAFVKQHPLATMSAAIGIGLLIGAMTKPGRRLTKRSGALAVLAMDALVDYGTAAMEKAGEAAREGQDRLEDLGDSLNDKARVAKREATHLIGSASDRTRTASRTASRKAGRAARSLRDRINR
jgi:ElaB/YqjD/DUF883 family membrane-anchored ribosome-binding protein